MHAQQPAIRRREDGSIDADYYARIALAARRAAFAGAARLIAGFACRIAAAAWAATRSHLLSISARTADHAGAQFNRRTSAGRWSLPGKDATKPKQPDTRIGRRDPPRIARIRIPSVEIYRPQGRIKSFLPVCSRIFRPAIGD